MPGCFTVQGKWKKPEQELERCWQEFRVSLPARETANEILPTTSYGSVWTEKWHTGCVHRGGETAFVVCLHLCSFSARWRWNSSHWGMFQRPGVWGPFRAWKWWLCWHCTITPQSCSLTGKQWRPHRLLQVGCTAQKVKLGWAVLIVFRRLEHRWGGLGRVRFFVLLCVVVVRKLFFFCAWLCALRKKNR